MTYATPAPKTSSQPDLSPLVAAISRNADSALGRFLESYRWTVLAEYVRPLWISRSQVLIGQGASERKLYFLESGDLQVDIKSDAGLVRVALLGPGSVVGEGSFFSHLTRSATVVAYSDAKVWELDPQDFKLLSRQHPSVALALSTALGAVLATRMLDISKRLAIT